MLSKKFKRIINPTVNEELKTVSKNHSNDGLCYQPDLHKLSKTSPKLSNFDSIYVKAFLQEYNLDKGTCKVQKKFSQILEIYEQGMLTSENNVHLTINFDPDLENDNLWERASLSDVFKKVLKIPISELMISGGKDRK